jgi:transcriptional regulator with XRE-family HTH domain
MYTNRTYIHTYSYLQVSDPQCMFTKSLYMKTLGDKIRYFRNLKGWSQEEVAFKLDMSITGYSKIERDVTDVNFKRLTQIAKVLGVSLVDMVSLTDKGLGRPEHDLEKLLAEKDKEINRLQKRIIELLERKEK